jgi:hypothetical protein
MTFRAPKSCPCAGSISPPPWLFEVDDGSRRCEKVVRVDLSRQQIVKALRHAGMREIADLAETTLPDPVDEKTVSQFCDAYGVSRSSLMDRMGASP